MCNFCIVLYKITLIFKFELNKRTTNNLYCFILLVNLPQYLNTIFNNLTKFKYQLFNVSSIVSLLVAREMEYNREEAYRCVELTKLYIKKKDLDKALKFSIKANKLYPTTETKCKLYIYLFIKLSYYIHYE